MRGRIRTKRPGAEEVEQGGTDNTAIHQFESDPGLLTFPLPGANPEKGVLMRSFYPLIVIVHTMNLTIIIVWIISTLHGAV